MSKFPDVLSMVEEKNKRVSHFGDILDSLSTSDEKKKLLWKEIYENAVTDRENAYMLYMSLYASMSTGSAADHAAHGGMLVKYLERMGKSNDQIIKLAEMIKETEEQEGVLSDEDIFSKISKEG
jgi:hypothetical protein